MGDGIGTIGRSVQLLLNRFFRFILSVPIYCKILGVGGLVGALFGSVTAYQINYELSSNLYNSLKNQSVLVGHLLTNQLARPLAVENTSEVRDVLRNIMADSEEIRYIIVEDNNSSIIAKVFATEREEEVFGLDIGGNKDTQQLVWRKHGDIVVWESITPLLDGYFGHVRVGLSDVKIASALHDVNISFLWTLAFCMLAGQFLALLLTYYLTKPVHHLVTTAKTLADGDFSKRANVFFDDEIGELAKAFNSMAKNIEAGNNLIKEKEQMRSLLVKKLVSKGEEERQSIARELHDELGQSLSLLLLQIQSSECDISKSACALRGDFSEFIRNLVDDVRNMAFILRPAELDDYGLDSAIRRYIQKIEHRSKLTMEYQYMGENPRKRLPKEIEIMLYRIAQEAISNVIRHSQAKHVSIVLVDAGSHVKLIVEDDGVGFKRDDNAAGLGILGMHERASIIRGSIIVESYPGEGTTIKITTPIQGVE